MSKQEICEIIKSKFKCICYGSKIYCKAIEEIYKLVKHDG